MDTEGNAFGPLVDSRLKGDIVMEKFAGIPSTTPIRVLSLSHRGLHDQHAVALARALHSSLLPHLEVLDLGWNEMTARGLQEIVGVLRAGAQHHQSGGGDAPALQTLVVDGNPIGDAGASHLSALIREYTGLQWLSCAHCDIATSGVIEIASALSVSTSLVHLDLSEPRLFSQNEETTVHIGDALRGNRSLRSLVLRGWPHFTHTSISSLCDFLLDNGCLQELDVSRNHIAGPGGATLARALVSGLPLRRLRVAHCRIGDEGASALAEAVMHGCTLRELDVRHNAIGDAGLTSLARAIHARMLSPSATGEEEQVHVASALDVLLVAGNDLTAGHAGTVAIAECLRDNITTTLLDVKQYSVDGVLQLALL